MDAFFRTIPGLLEAMDESDEVKKAFVFAGWKRVAGEQILERTAPIEFDDKRLVIAVSDKAWQRNLESFASQLLFKLNALLGSQAVLFIEFRIEPSSIEKEARNDADDADQQKALERLPQEIAASASAIGDPELKKKVMLAAANCLARRTRR